MFKRLKEQIEAESHEKSEKTSKSAIVDTRQASNDEAIVCNENETCEEEAIVDDASSTVSHKSRTTSIGDDFPALQDDCDQQSIRGEKSSPSVLHEQNESIKNELQRLKSEASEVHKLRAEKEMLTKQNSELLKVIDGLKRSLENEVKLKEEVKKEFEVFKESYREKQIRTEIVVPEEDTVSASALKDKVSFLENELNDKIKIIRLQNQKMKDMKKSLENGDLLPLRRKGDIPTVNSNSDLYDSSSTDNSPRLPRKAKSVPDSNNVESVPCNVTIFNEISFQYLKNLVYKFVTCSECEAQQLIKALSVLLKFTAEEEKSIKDILDWRMSWYKNLPIVGNGLKPHTLSK